MRVFSSGKKPSCLGIDWPTRTFSVLRKFFYTLIFIAKASYLSSKTAWSTKYLTSSTSFCNYSNLISSFSDFISLSCNLALLSSIFYWSCSASAPMNSIFFLFFSIFLNPSPSYLLIYYYKSYSARWAFLISSVLALIAAFISSSY